MDNEYYEQSYADEVREALAYEPVISDDEFYGAWDSYEESLIDEDFLYEVRADK